MVPSINYRHTIFTSQELFPQLILFSTIFLSGAVTLFLCIGCFKFKPVSTSRHCIAPHLIRLKKRAAPPWLPQPRTERLESASPAPMLQSVLYRVLLDLASLGQSTRGPVSTRTQHIVCKRAFADQEPQQLPVSVQAISRRLKAVSQSI